MLSMLQYLLECLHFKDHGDKMAAAMHGQPCSFPLLQAEMAATDFYFFRFVPPQKIYLYAFVAVIVGTAEPTDLTRQTYNVAMCLSAAFL